MTLFHRGAVAALTVTCVLGLAGCGGSDKPTDNGVDATQADATQADEEGAEAGGGGDAGKGATDTGDTDDTGDTGDTDDDTGTDTETDTGATVPVAEAWATSAAAAGSVAQSDEYDFDCPAGGTTASEIWGGDDGQYTDDSSICVAAVHAGLITPARGGTVHVTTTEGLDSYGGSTANGVTSTPWGAWGTSFEVSAG